MENRLFKQAYLYSNPVAMRNTYTKKSKPGHVRRASQAMEIRHTAEFNQN